MVNNQIILFKFIQINDNVDLFEIPYNYKLSESFIKEFQDKVNWYEISINQKLSINFKKNYLFYINNNI